MIEAAVHSHCYTMLSTALQNPSVHSGPPFVSWQASSSGGSTAEVEKLLLLIPSCENPLHHCVPRPDDGHRMEGRMM